MNKQTEIVKYIIEVADELNKKYPNILSPDKINQAISMFANSKKTYEEVVDEIDAMATLSVKKYIKLLGKGPTIAEEQKGNQDRNSRTFGQIRDVVNKVQKLLDSYGLKIFISGGSVPYLLLNQDSNRLHDDVDTVCRLEDMEKLREVFKQAGLYQEEWDSKNFAKDGKGYGFEMKIDGVPFGIYPFSFDNGVLTQHSYDPYNTQCKIKKLPLERLTDYIFTYEGADGKTYDTMSLEYIKMTKDFAKREKDIVDSLKISETGKLRPDVMGRVKMYTEVQNTKANELEPQLEILMGE